MIDILYYVCVLLLFFCMYLCFLLCIYLCYYPFILGKDVYTFGGEYSLGDGGWRNSVWRWRCQGLIRKLPFQTLFRYVQFRHLHPAQKKDIKKSNIPRLGCNQRLLTLSTCLTGCPCSHSSLNAPFRWL